MKHLDKLLMKVFRRTIKAWPVIALIGIWLFVAHLEYLEHQQMAVGCTHKYCD